MRSVPCSSKLKKNQFLRAVKHGAFAKTAILPGEDPKEFEELHSAVIEEWAPVVGPTEEDAVLSIAKGIWRKRRFQKFLHAKIAKCRADREHPLYDEAQAVRTLLNTLETYPLEYLEPLPDDPELTERMPHLAEAMIRDVIESSAPPFLTLMLERMCPREFASQSERDSNF